MSSHVDYGKLYQMSDEEVRKLADHIQGEWDEMHRRYGMQGFFGMAVVRQARANDDDEDVELQAAIYGCMHCLPFFLARAVIGDAKMAQLFSDTLRWIDKLREKPDATVIDLEDLPVGDGKPN